MLDRGDRLDVGTRLPRGSRGASSPTSSGPTRRAATPAAPCSSASTSRSASSHRRALAEVGRLGARASRRWLRRPVPVPEPVWARFVRLTIPARAQPAATSWRCPPRSRDPERATDETYRSVLGEWASRATRALRGLLPAPARRPRPPTSRRRPDTPGAARTVVGGEAVTGHVGRGSDVDWLQPLPSPQATTRSRSTRRRADRWPAGAGRLVDAAGLGCRSVRARRGPRPRLRGRPCRARAYRLRVEQPALSVVFAWDTSASWDRATSQTCRGIGAFAADITPGKRPCRSSLPSRTAAHPGGWSDQAYSAQGAMDAFTYRPVAAISRPALTTPPPSCRTQRHACCPPDTEASPRVPEHDEAWLEPQVRHRSFPRPLRWAGRPGHLCAPAVRLVGSVSGGFYQYATSQAEIDRPSTGWPPGCAARPPTS